MYTTKHNQRPYGLVDNALALHAIDPGSIPVKTFLLEKVYVFPPKLFCLFVCDLFFLYLIDYGVRLRLMLSVQPRNMCGKVKPRP